MTGSPGPDLAEVDRLLARGDYRVAFERLAALLRARPRDALVLCAMGRLYLALGQHADAAQAYQRAQLLEPLLAEPWQALAALRTYNGDADGAVAIYRRAIDQGVAASDLRLGLVVALADLGRRDEAAVEAGRVVVDEPSNARAWRVLGELLATLGRHADAAVALGRSVALDPRPAEVHHNLGLAFDASGDRARAAQAMSAALERDPECWPALAQLAFLKRQLADWDGLDVLSARLRAAVRDERPGITPFSFLAEPGTPEEQLACARTWARLRQVDAERDAPRLTRWQSPRKRADAPIRVGFASSGFHNHPTALLVVDLVERLRDGSLDTYGFATAPDDDGALRQRIARAFRHFEDVSPLDHAAMTRRMREADLDVVFDLRGYGGGAITEVFALRVAPLQVNWLAYPGTSGAPFIDYLLADAYVVPPAERACYSEAVIRLPHAFQPSDTTRVVGEPPARRDCGLPESGLVLASFNNGYKFTPEVFAAWTRILRELPHAVLWLLGTEQGELAGSLRRRAAASGIDPMRLRFQPKLPHLQYLTRYRHVDLFLDTWPYGAHTTASDALWAGCPVLTWSGRTYASRVAGSLLDTLRLNELIAESADDYVERAIALGRDPARLGSLRGRLAAARQTSPLFDMARFAEDFTRAVCSIVERQRAGLQPADLESAAALPGNS
jgi:predicted O-linked N-acetylglucosamine transferase (SPINDLY family)